MFLLETCSPTLATLIFTIFKTTQVALPTLINLLTLLEPFSYFTYGMIDVLLLLEIIYSPLILGPPLLRLAL
jgi:hypothetical protein